VDNGFYPTLVDETRDGVQKKLPRASLDGRFMPLFVGYKTPPPQPDGGAGAGAGGGSSSSSASGGGDGGGGSSNGKSSGCGCGVASDQGALPATALLALAVLVCARRRPRA
jgi:MYXO-CTERM domain-containing protein